ncbi:carbohydrate ABC transporter permease [Mesotoga sp. B105.6.4]|jgi:multiple sugar transport system permease protein|uniref:carbohydrate ABC transporter permease n=1 Tax=Mesotoga sp. B105.6.4 TaxID=1582224 RepID=UPI0007496249|nr:carbohydrate ABC transporter permease [Mesotoga sp. B105.6.4]KUK93907.1 MAG: ABC-type sugar transport system, permease component [Thermotogales bacterium 46_20]PNS39603.1 sugar ABC transporter permease [Mesotoga sp. B105.6.4]
MKTRRVKGILRYFLLVILAMFFLFPIYWMFVSSLKSPSEIFAFPPKLIPENPVWSNYTKVFSQVPFARYMLNTFFVASVVTIVALLLHSMAAYSLARLNYRGRNFLFILVISTLMIPFSAILIPLFLIVRNFGWIDSYRGLIIPAIPHAFGIFFLRQFYLGFPRELEEAAIIDGSGLVRVFFKIVLPLSKPVLSALAVFFFLANWNSFMWPLVIINSPQMRTVQLGIAQYGGEYNNPWAIQLAACTVALIPTLIVFVVLQKQLMQSIKMTGMKL